MTRDYQPHEISKGKIEISIARMVEKYPFHVAILERFKSVARAEVATLGVTVSGKDILLLHNPDFVLEISADELRGALLHEVHHVLFGHVIANPAYYPDEWARAVAEEVTANEFITEEALPSGVITLEQFPKLPRMESTDDRYKRLSQVKRRSLISPPVFVQVEVEATGGESGGNGTRGQGGDGHGSGQANGDQHGGGQGQGCNGRGVGGQSGGGKRSSPGPAHTQQDGAGGRRPAAGATKSVTHRTLDDHRVWEEARKAPREAEAVIDNVIREAVLDVGAELVPVYIRGPANASAGNAPGRGLYELEGNEVGKLPWQQLLHRYIGQARQVRPVFNHPPRRFPDLVGIIPGKRRQPDRPKLMVAIDTSASMTDDLLELIDAELAKLAKGHEVMLVECDFSIQRVSKYRSRLKTLAGRGGTSFHPPLEKHFLRKHHPDLIVYFTDGCGSAPEQPPGVPLIWCLTPQGQAPVDWGRKIQMEDH
jgi:predicted metal-dependent peptidase